MTTNDPQSVDLTKPIPRDFGKPEPQVGPKYWTGERIASWVAGAGALAVFLAFCAFLIVKLAQAIL